MVKTVIINKHFLLNFTGYFLEPLLFLQIAGVCARSDLAVDGYFTED